MVYPQIIRFYCRANRIGFGIHVRSDTRQGLISSPPRQYKLHKPSAFQVANFTNIGKDLFDTLYVETVMLTVRNNIG